MDGVCWLVWSSFFVAVSAPRCGILRLVQTSTLSDTAEDFFLVLF